LPGVAYPLGTVSQLAHTADLCREHGAAVLTAHADVRDLAAVEHAVAQAHERFGVLDVRGVRDREQVGTCLERSADLVTVLLGVLKAGAVYVPMDPGYPADRLTYTVRDGGIRVVIGMPGEFPADQGGPGDRP
jgi:non-ribosomal peptide synthetase component F